jgi:hypothetical protein
MYKTLCYAEFPKYYVQMDILDRAFEQVKQMLYGRLHDVLKADCREGAHPRGSFIKTKRSPER